MDKFSRRISSFRAVDSDGKPYTIHEYQEYMTGRDRSGTFELPGFKRLELDDGTPVNWKEKGIYEIVSFTTIRVTSDDPSAP